MSQNELKTCSACGEQKSPSEFYFNKAMNCLYARCKPCHTKLTKRWKQKHHEEYLSQQRSARNSPECRVRSRELTAKYRKREDYKARERAYRKVEKSVKAGVVVPPTSCPVCGHDFSVHRRESHHFDYSKQLDVLWCCSSCHGKIHEELYAGGARPLGLPA